MAISKKPVTKAMKAAEAAKAFSNVEVELKNFQLNFYLGELITHVVLSPQDEKHQWSLVGVKYSNQSEVQFLKEPAIVKGSKSFGSRKAVESDGYFHPSYTPKGITTLPKGEVSSLREWLSKHSLEGFPEPVGSTAWSMRTKLAYCRKEYALPSFEKELYKLSQDIYAYKQRDWLEKKFPGFKSGEEKAIKAVIEAVLNPVEGEVVSPHLPINLFLWAAVLPEEESNYGRDVKSIMGRPEGTDGMR